MGTETEALANPFINAYPSGTVEQLEGQIGSTKIAGLSSGECVGLVADNPTEKIDLKAFHCEIINHHESLASEEKAYTEILRLMNDPEL